MKQDLHTYGPIMFQTLQILDSFYWMGMHLRLNSYILLSHASYITDEEFISSSTYRYVTTHFLTTLSKVFKTVMISPVNG